MFLLHATILHSTAIAAYRIGGDRHHCRRPERDSHHFIPNPDGVCWAVQADETGLIAGMRLDLTDLRSPTWSDA
jgi:hypothetical protein